MSFALLNLQFFNRAQKEKSASLITVFFPLMIVLSAYYPWKNIIYLQLSVSISDEFSPLP